VKRIDRKILRLLLFLLSTLLVMTASAAVYNYMYMQATPIGAQAAKVQFITAADSTSAGAVIGTNGTWCKLTSMVGWPNSTRTYQAAVGIQNVDTSSGHSFNLTFAQAGDWSGNTNNVTSITVIVRSTAGGTQQGNTINVGTAGSTTGQITIPASTTWVVEWNITWKASTHSSAAVNVKLTLVVTGT
jgi:hypothetical protein